MRWVLTGFQVQGVRRAVEVSAVVQKPLVVLNGRSGAGKSSVLTGVAWALAGEVRTEEGKFTLEEIGSRAHPTIVQLGFVGPDGEGLAIERLMGASQTIVVNGESGGVTAMTPKLEAALGVTCDQLSYLMSTNRLILMKPLEQAETLGGLVSPVFELEDIMPPEDVPAGVIATIREVAAGFFGSKRPWPALEAAVTALEKKRTEASAERDGNDAHYEALASGMQARLREARVADISVLASVRATANANHQRALAHLEALNKQVWAREEHQAKKRDARAQLDAAEVAISEVKEKITRANSVRDEREAARAAVKHEMAQVNDNLELLRAEGDALVKAELAALAANDALHSTLSGVAGEDVSDCPTCGQKITTDRRLQIDLSLADAQTKFEQARNATVEQAGRIKEAEEALQALEERLLTLPCVPDAADLEERLAAAARSSDRASEELEELAKTSPPDPVASEALEAAQRNVDENAARCDLLDGISGDVAAVERAFALAEGSRGRRAVLDAAVKHLRAEKQRLAGGEGLEAVLARVNDALRGRLTIDCDEKAGLVAVFGKPPHEERFPANQLSRGERLEVGVALQGCIAQHLGVGVALVDDAGVWDPITAREMMEEMARFEGVTWLVGSAYPAELLPGDIAEIITVDGGYS